MQLLGRGGDFLGALKQRLSLLFLLQLFLISFSTRWKTAMNACLELLEAPLLLRRKRLFLRLLGHSGTLDLQKNKMKIDG